MESDKSQPLKFSKLLHKAADIAEQIEVLERDLEWLLQTNGTGIPPSVNRVLSKEIGRISGEVNERIHQCAPIIGLHPRKDFPAGFGLNTSELTWERALPTNADDTWTMVS